MYEDTCKLLLSSRTFEVLVHEEWIGNEGIPGEGSRLKWSWTRMEGIQVYSDFQGVMGTNAANAEDSAGKLPRKSLLNPATVLHSTYS